MHFDHILGNPKGKSIRRTGAKTDKLDKLISAHIKSVLNKTGGKVHDPGGAAELLGINAHTLRNRMNKLGNSYGRMNA